MAESSAGVATLKCDMTLNGYVAGQRTAIFEDLRAGRSPSVGAFDGVRFREAKDLGAAQMGSVRFAPDSLELEFIYPDPKGSARVLVVTLTPPERIVFLPVPEWVVESIWQGEISGSYVFESEAEAHLARFTAMLTPEGNAPLFGRKEPTRRE